MSALPCIADLGGHIMIFRVGLRRKILPTIILAAVVLGVALNASTGFAASEAEAVAKAVQSSSDIPSLCKGGTEAVTKKVMATTMALMQSGTISNPHDAGPGAGKLIRAECEKLK